MNKAFLIADDDTDDADLFQLALSRVAPDVQCHIAENGRQVFELLEALQDNNPDFIFLDINMPKMDGWHCLEKLKTSKTYSNIPAIMYSTSSARQDIEKAYSMGAALFISKPDDFAELSKILAVLASATQAEMIQQLTRFRNVQLKMQ